jgi:hypothetical protein
MDMFTLSQEVLIVSIGIGLLRLRGSILVSGYLLLSAFLPPLLKFKIHVQRKHCGVAHIKEVLVASYLRVLKLVKDI